jgi:hypothetical protein
VIAAPDRDTQAGAVPGDSAKSGRKRGGTAFAVSAAAHMGTALKRVSITIPGWDAAGPGNSVLLVSGDADFRAVAGRVLLEAGYAAETAAHGGHALLACMRQRFDLVLVDAVGADEAGSITGGLLRHIRGGRTIALGRRPRNADELLAIVATSCRLAGTANRRAGR